MSKRFLWGAVIVVILGYLAYRLGRAFRLTTKAAAAPPSEPDFIPGDVESSAPGPDYFYDLNLNGWVRKGSSYDELAAANTPGQTQAPLESNPDSVTQPGTAPAFGPDENQPPSELDPFVNLTSGAFGTE